MEPMSFGTRFLGDVPALRSFGVMSMPALRSKLVVLILLPTLASAPICAQESQSSSIATPRPQTYVATATQDALATAPIAHRAHGYRGLRPLRLCTYLGCPGVTLGGVGF